MICLRFFCCRCKKKKKKKNDSLPRKWRSNLVMSKLHLNFVSIWVQLHGLSLEYHYPELVERMGQMIGSFEKIDWEDSLPRNIKLLDITQQFTFVIKEKEQQYTDLTISNNTDRCERQIQLINTKYI